MTKNSIIPYAIISSLSQLDNIYETRLFGWVLAKAQSVLKLYNRDLGDINMQHALNMVRCTMPARYLLQKGDTNYKNIIKAFTLARKTVEYEREGHLYHLNIIAFPEVIKRGSQCYCTFVIHNELWHALLNFSQGYRLISLPTYMKLQSTYSVIMYILVSQQRDPFTYHMNTLKRILGVEDKKAYQRGNNFISKVIDAAKKELDEKSPYSFEYSVSREGRGGAFTNITLIPCQRKSNKDEHGQQHMHIQRLRVRLTENVIEYLEYGFGMNPTEQESIEVMLQAIGDEQQQLSWLANVKERAALKRVANPAGYLVQALRHYA